uniref:Uncharacterized protein n=1 Tax=Grammatophora oceanica TaxID=210454 RepID=A0A7S1V7Y7_9STRA|mmetsp:Transcript_39161/g.58194  ORF Transcript_39161/g.58194 Transcript_39161/m.58194 type:complete len:298 (+) Transcript_39161:3-896(+)
MSDNFGRTPLHLACEDGDLDVIQYLIEERGVDVGAKSEEIGSTLEHAVMNHETPRLQAVLAYLLPLCPVDKEVIADVFKTEYDSFRNVPWPVKAMVLKHVSERRLKGAASTHSRGKFSFDANPLRGVFCCPLPSTDAYQESISELVSQRNPKKSLASVLDDFCRVPLHHAIEACVRDEHVTPKIVLMVLEEEPRAAAIRDPITCLFPFEAVAAACVGAEVAYVGSGADEARRGDEEDSVTDSDDEECSISSDATIGELPDDDESWLELMYQLLRYDPSFVRSRGLGFSFRKQCQKLA